MEYCDRVIMSEMVKTKNYKLAILNILDPENIISITTTTELVR